MFASPMMKERRVEYQTLLAIEHRPPAPPPAPVAVSEGPPLLPCPFCGGLPCWGYKSGDWGYTPASCAVLCESCGASTRRVSDRDHEPSTCHAIAAGLWNRRYVPARINRPGGSGGPG